MARALPNPLTAGHGTRSAGPNRRCTCGYTRFSDRRTPSSVSVDRWMLFDTETSAGLGSTPLGTYLGAGMGPQWGLFTSNLKTTTIITSCESCGRSRSSNSLGGFAMFGSYVENGFIYIAGSDVAGAACFSLRFTGDETYTEPLSLIAGSPPMIVVASAPPMVLPDPPSGAPTVDALLRARLPEVLTTGTYQVDLVDRCCGCETFVDSIILEAPPMILSPLDADLNGAPERWLRGQGQQPLAMLASGSRPSIPFDKCSVVHEYDSRFGTLPATQGWTHVGSGSDADYALVEGGALRGQTSADSYWEKTTVVAADPERMFAYGVVSTIVDTPYATEGDGPEISGRYAKVIANPYHGARVNLSDFLWGATALDGASDITLETEPDALGWTRVAVGDDSVADREQIWVSGRGFSIPNTTFGTDGSAAALDVISTFGDVSGAGSDLVYRNVVMSYGGRFIRAFFDAQAQVTNPVLRLYLVADTNSSVSKLARFKIRYGAITADPYEIPAAEVSATVNLVAANTTYEAPLTLSGMTVSLPFWFSVERVWDHADDDLEACVHLLQVSVRSS